MLKTPASDSKASASAASSTKKVEFIRIAPDIYNLALLDYHPLTNEFSDISVTDNGNMREVIATVITILERFLASNPGQKIYFAGSTPARTRLYQIAISQVFDPESDLSIEGYVDGQWIDFEPNICFEGFLVKKKA
jgi:hypothetical protein